MKVRKFSKTYVLECSRKMPVFQGAAPWHTIFTSSCVIPLWDSATAHSPYVKELILSSLEESCFSELIVLLMFSYYPAWALFGTHPYYSLNPYVYLYYLWSVSIAKDHRSPKCFILCVLYFYSERLPLCR